mgnify:CR=1 FL=1
MASAKIEIKSAIDKVTFINAATSGSFILSKKYRFVWFITWNHLYFLIKYIERQRTRGVNNQVIIRDEKQ